MITAVLRDALRDLAPWVQREHRGWWRSWSDGGRHVFDVRGQIEAALAPRGEARGDLVDALAAALVVNRDQAAALSAADSLCAWADAGNADDIALARAVRARLAQPAPRLHELVDGIDSPVAALAVYLLTLRVIDDSRPAGRVWLEDLAEALLLPPTLFRQVRRSWSRCEPVKLAASA